jgi:hypothetical protein
MARGSDYITEARQATRKLWDAVNALKALQLEYNALDYGNTLADGVGENEGYTKAEVGSVVFDTTEAILTLFGQGHSTNVAKLL